MSPVGVKFVDYSIGIQSFYHVISVFGEDFTYEYFVLVSFGFFLITEDHCSLSVVDEPDTN
jgi:hypothetical protein